MPAISWHSTTSFRAGAFAPLPHSPVRTCPLLLGAAPPWCPPHQRWGQSLGVQIFPPGKEAWHGQSSSALHVAEPDSMPATVQTVWRGLPKERGSWTIFWHHNPCIRDAEMWKSLLWAAAKKGRTAASFRAVQDHCQAEDMGYVYQWVLVCLVAG